MTFATTACISHDVAWLYFTLCLRSHPNLANRNGSCMSVVYKTGTGCSIDIYLYDYFINHSRVLLHIDVRLHTGIESYEDANVKLATLQRCNCNLFLHRIKASHMQGYGSYLPLYSACQDFTEPHDTSIRPQENAKKLQKWGPHSVPLSHV